MSTIHEEKHSDIKVVLNDNADHYMCITIIDGQIYHDMSVEGFTEKVAMIDTIETLLEKLKKS